MFDLRILLLVFMLFTAGCTEQKAGSALAIGEQLPVFSAQKLQGGYISSNTFAGKWVILNVWATWCGPCRKELPSLQRLSDRLDAAQWRVIGLALETDDHAVREYLAEKQIVYENYLDAGAKIDQQVLGLVVLPATYVIGPDGRIREVVLGDRVWDSEAMIRHLISLK